MSTPSIIPVPSPQLIHDTLFGDFTPNLPTFSAWTASMLLTPFGGLTASALPSPDQLVVANVEYEVASEETLMRTSLYLLESLCYYDFLFSTRNGATQWWWLESDPSTRNVSAVYGPFSTAAQVPGASFLPANNFAFAGTWNVVGQACDAFAALAPGAGPAGTWYSFDHKTSNLRRIMNVDNSNDFKVAVLGAYYLAHVATLTPTVSQSLADVFFFCLQNAQSAPTPSPMVTLNDLQAAMCAPPTGVQVSCQLGDIQALIPGISFPAPDSVPTPAWTNQVQSNCYMIGQDPLPYYCQVYYDYTFGDQVTVFAFPDQTGAYNSRQDELLPKGTVGPSVNYSWNDSQWMAQCYTPAGSFVPMSVPDFVAAGGGSCRALIQNHHYFGSLSIWSIPLAADPQGGSGSNFWDWFDMQQNGVLFSLAPASSLTLIDYQTFVRDASIDPTYFNEPLGSTCSSRIQRARLKTVFTAP